MAPSIRLSQLQYETEWTLSKLPEQMSRVSVTINRWQFRMACEDGQEGYLMNLAREIDNRINHLRSKFGEIGDTGLIVMLAITMADELAEVGQRIKRLEEKLVAISDGNNAAQDAFAVALSRAAERVENVTKSLNQMVARGGIALG
jgi:cell division protein ZapA